ncbi:hypothetical protein [Nonomuraea helvata]|uniref:Uncharacterized protein n=1 Tax=Nonomuraea helvata TaxID=37484 RepID=A0ABV5SL98_9ACTN
MTSVDKHVDPHLRAKRLIGMAERLDAHQVSRLTVLPDSLPAAPEAALALPRLHLHLRTRPWPTWREADLPTRVRIAWLSAEIAVHPDTLRGEPVGELLYQAVRVIETADVDEPERLARELIDKGDAVLRAEAERIARDALHAGLLAPSEPGRSWRSSDHIHPASPEPCPRCTGTWLSFSLTLQGS